MLTASWTAGQGSALMARKVEVLLIDDIDDSPAAETIAFAFDGKPYEIDLSEQHAAELRESFARWVSAGRKVSTRVPTQSTGPRSRSDRKDLRQLRQWAAENGFTMSERGRISTAVQEAFDAAH